jgi:phosphatidylglycerophosphatase A
MIRLHKIIASCLGIGFIKGGGTIAAAIFAAGWFFLLQGNRIDNIMLLVTSLITAIGIWSSYKVEPSWGKDSNRVVIDEAAGICISLLFVPVSWQHVLIALLLFRFFDILKPLFIRRAESLPGGWGVMMDDVLAGVYSNIVLQVMIYYKIV